MRRRVGVSRRRHAESRGRGRVGSSGSRPSGGRGRAVRERELLRAPDSGVARPACASGAWTLRRGCAGSDPHLDGCLVHEVKGGSREKRGGTCRPCRRED